MGPLSLEQLLPEARLLQDDRLVIEGIPEGKLALYASAADIVRHRRVFLPLADKQERLPLRRPDKTRYAGQVVADFEFVLAMPDFDDTRKTVRNKDSGVPFLRIHIEIKEPADRLLLHVDVHLALLARDAQVCFPVFVCSAPYHRNVGVDVLVLGLKRQVRLVSHCLAKPSGAFRHLRRRH